MNGVPFMSRRLWISVTALMLVVAAVVVALALSMKTTSGSARTGSIGSKSTPRVSASAFPPARARTLERELRSGDQEQLSDALALPHGQALDPVLIPGLRQLRRVSFDESSFVTRDGHTAQMDAIVVGSQGRSSPWTVYLTNSGGVWKVVATNLTGAK
jgi:hypothetical protein